jgi:hypothetical protein
MLTGLNDMRSGEPVDMGRARTLGLNPNRFPHPKE